ncbi:MAG: SLBB domain-containing protein [Bacteroidota bacterium]|nr:SLBB domain-containing protein [Bacteroidota bacterium]MDP4191161.1 SLBB domain-containing protein [Bacteroidota bacterium]MDP4195034.1 SLBB domain-containing protein [Bacteroidota bacterium]
MLIRIYSFCFLFTLFALSSLLMAQSNGSAFYKIDNQTGELTKKINLWGYVKNPGRYEVPASTNLVQMIAYAGGPRDHALMDEVKVYSTLENGKSISKKVDLENPSRSSESDLILTNEDTIIVDYSSSVTIGEIFSFVGAPLAIVTSLILIADRLKK